LGESTPRLFSNEFDQAIGILTFCWFATVLSMLIFEYVLILLAAVLLSNFINRFMPVLSPPFLQIILGVFIALVPFGASGFRLEIQPELFFILFIAPLVFYASMTADKKTLWEMKGPIIGAAVALVFITVLLVGYALNAMVPAIPLTATFILIAALGPTDDVAVFAVGKRVAVPRKIMGILSGESIINDASGIVCFQFAVAAALTGSFSITRAAGQFLLVGLGGIFAGLALTFLKYALTKWLRSHGIENVTLHILIGLLTPFVIYMAAEGLNVSGILAVFAAGVAHSFARVQLNPETVNLNIALESLWSVLSFTFEGIVFVMLGTQLPGILKSIGEHSIDGRQIVVCVLLIMLVFAALRFAWWIFAIREKSYQEPDKPISKIKSGIIFSLAGARGSVTLAAVMSIPVILTDGSVFPERDLIILLASGVIVVSMLITNFILPLFVERKTEQRKNEAELEACVEIVQKTTARLLAEATEENRMATSIVVKNYYNRDAAPKQGFLHIETAEDKKLLEQALIWEKENTISMFEKGAVSESAAKHFIELLEYRLESHDSKRLAHRKSAVSDPAAKHAIDVLYDSIQSDDGRGVIWKIAWFNKHFFRFNRFMHKKDDRKDFLELLNSNSLFVLTKLKEMRDDDNAEAVDKLISKYELISVVRDRRAGRVEKDTDSESDDSLVYKVAARGFQIERGLIQEMFEAGRISRHTAKEMRGNIATLEARFYVE